MKARSLAQSFGTGFLLASTAMLALAVGSCSVDPRHSKLVEEQGGEIPGYPSDTEYHRPGQVCTACHTSQGPADSRFVIAGTIFWGPCLDNRDDKKCDRTPVSGAEVRMVDASGSSICVVTNCAGNFFIRADDPYVPNFRFPFLVSVSKVHKGAVIAERPMTSHVGREATCAGCHSQVPFADSPGQVRLMDDMKQIPKDAKAVCPPPPGAPPFQRYCE